MIFMSFIEWNRVTVVALLLRVLPVAKNESKGCGSI